MFHDNLFQKQEEPEVQDERKKMAMAESIQQFGTVPAPAAESNIFCMTIIGQIEGHLVLPPQNKTTKYEHLIPQLVAAEQNAKLKASLLY